MPRGRNSESGSDQGHASPVTVSKEAWPLCLHTTNGRRCFLSPDIGDNGRRYCHWHSVMLQDPRDVQSFEEFERWKRAWSGHCTPLNHWNSSELWDAIQGIRDLHSKPHWCGLVICKYFSLVDTAGWVRARMGLLRPERKGSGNIRIPRDSYQSILEQERSMLTESQRARRDQILRGQRVDDAAPCPVPE